MEKRKLFFISVLCNIFLIANASEFYVSNKGNDASNGSESNPWETINYAAQQLKAGDVLYVLPGTYNEYCTIIQKASLENPIVITTRPGEENLAILDGTGVTILFDGLEEEQGGLIQVIQASNIEIRNLNIINSPKEGVIAYESENIIIDGVKTLDTESSGIASWDCNNVTINNCTVENACFDKVHEFITVAGTQNFVVSNCHVLNTSNISVKEGIDAKDGSSDGQIFGNTVENLAAAGIYLDAWTENTGNISVYNNYVDDCNGIALASEGGGLLHDINVYNNICINNFNYGVVFGNWGDESASTRPIRNVYVYHNTICHNGYGDTWGGGISLENQSLDNINIFNNICSGNNTFQISNESNLGNTEISFIGNLVYGKTDYGYEVPQAAFINEDPLIDLNNLLVLNENSPAIDAAESTSILLTMDYNGDSRSIDGDDDGASVNDIGAIEYSSGGGINSIEDIEKPKHNNVFPNPFSDIIRINTNQTIGGIYIYNIQGKLIHFGIEPVVNTSGWEPGIYCVRFMESNGVAFDEKIVKY